MPLGRLGSSSPSDNLLHAVARLSIRKLSPSLPVAREITHLDLYPSKCGTPTWSRSRSRLSPRLGDMTLSALNVKRGPRSDRVQKCELLPTVGASTFASVGIASLTVVAPLRDDHPKSAPISLAFGARISVHETRRTHDRRVAFLEQWSPQAGHHQLRQGDHTLPRTSASITARTSLLALALSII
jgi:hypothetical protein